jgi:hypothetical protein
MARWVWPAAAGVVASATGVAINLATERAENPWAWVAVVLLTALGVVVAMRVQPAPGPAAQGPAAQGRAGEGQAGQGQAGQGQAEPPRPQPTVHNSVSGTVHGGVVQAGNLDSVTIHSPTTVNQTAVARDGGTVQQAGRDVNPGR